MNNIPNLNDMLKLYTKKDLWERIQHHIKRIDNLQTQLDQQKARIEELEGQFAYECECNKQFVQLQNMWNELKEWLKNQITDLRHIEIKTETQSLRVNDAVNCFREVLCKIE